MTSSVFVVMFSRVHLMSCHFGGTNGETYSFLHMGSHLGRWTFFCTETSRVTGLENAPSGHLSQPEVGLSPARDLEVTVSRVCR